MNYPAAFELFWAAYPRRIAKKAAFKAFEKAIREGATIEIILPAIEKYKAWLSSSDGWRPEPAHPQTWLNQGRWDDEYETEKVKNGTSKSFTSEGDRLAEKYRQQANIIPLVTKRQG